MILSFIIKYQTYFKMQENNLKYLTNLKEINQDSNLINRKSDCGKTFT